MKKKEWPLRQTGAEAMWLRVPPFHLDAYPSKWSKLWAIFRSPCGDNGCSFEGVLTVLHVGAAVELAHSSGECQVANENQEV